MTTLICFKAIIHSSKGNLISWVRSMLSLSWPCDLTTEMYTVHTESWKATFSYEKQMLRWGKTNQCLVQSLDIKNGAH